MKHEVFFLTNVFPCISFINITQRNIEKHTRVDFNLAQLYFWQTADPGQIYIWGLFIIPLILLEIIPELVFLMTRCRFSWLNHWKTYEEQLHRKLIVKDIYIFFPQDKTQSHLSVSENAISPACTVQFCTIYTVEQSFGVIPSIYRFKRDNFLSENVIFETKTCIQNGQYFERSLDPSECDVRRVERLVPPSLPDVNAQDCWRQWEQ